MKLDKTVEHQQARQMANDALAIMEGRAPLVPGQEGFRDIRVLEAIIECASNGQSVALA